MTTNKYFEEFASKKIIDPSELDKKILHIKNINPGKKIVTLNGSFDLLHAGHLHIIYEASLKGDILIIALNSDDSIKRYKGSSRPIINLKDRLSMVAALAFVKYVTWFEEDDPRNILSIIQPDIHVNGSEYGKDCIEAEVVKKYGGQVEVVNLIPGLSTSQIITNIKNNAHSNNN